MVFQRDFERKEYVDMTIDPFMGLNIKIHGSKSFFFLFYISEFVKHLGCPGKSTEWL